jgi:hypothetical protein
VRHGLGDPLEDPAAAFAVRLEEALGDETGPGPTERAARTRLTSQQVTLR